MSPGTTGRRRVSSPTCIGALAGVLLAVCSESADAKPRLDLSWRAPKECPTEAQVLSRAQRMLRDSRADVSVEASARVTRSTSGYVVALETRVDGGVGHRQLHAESCDAAASATALMLALAVDPGAQLGDPGEAPVGQTGAVDDAPAEDREARTARLPPRSKKGAGPERHRESAPEVVPASSLSREFRVLVGGEASWGVLPKLTGAPSAGLGFGVERLWVDLQGAYFPGSSETLSSDRRGGDFSRWALSLRAFYGLGGPRFRLGPAARIIATRIHGSGRGVSRPRSSDVWLGAAAFGPRLEWRPSALGLAVGAESGFPFTRPSFELDDLGNVYTPARVLLAGYLEALIVF
ncbi:MAG: hypothetical protein R3B89_08430 [Polyangiaceae bacterium]